MAATFLVMLTLAVATSAVDVGPPLDASQAPPCEADTCSAMVQRKARVAESQLAQLEEDIEGDKLIAHGVASDSLDGEEASTSQPKCTTLITQDLLQAILTSVEHWAEEHWSEMPSDVSMIDAPSDATDAPIVTKGGDSFLKRCTKSAKDTAPALTAVCAKVLCESFRLTHFPDPDDPANATTSELLQARVARQVAGRRQDTHDRKHAETDQAPNAFISERSEVGAGRRRRAGFCVKDSTFCYNPKTGSETWSLGGVTRSFWRSQVCGGWTCNGITGCWGGTDVCTFKVWYVNYADKKTDTYWCENKWVGWWYDTCNDYGVHVKGGTVDGYLDEWHPLWDKANNGVNCPKFWTHKNTNCRK